MEPISKIYFLNNPYPNGHKIVMFNWSGRIDEYGFIWFDFHLKTDAYYAEDRSEEGPRIPVEFGFGQLFCGGIDETIGPGIVVGKHVIVLHAVLRSM